jgi:hypothetical protein
LVPQKNTTLSSGVFKSFTGTLEGGINTCPRCSISRTAMRRKDEPQSYRTWILRDHKAGSPSKVSLLMIFPTKRSALSSGIITSPSSYFLSYNAPHTPLQAPQKYLDRFLNLKDKETQNLCRYGQCCR